MIIAADVPPNTNCVDKVDDIKPRRRDGTIRPISAALRVMYDMDIGSSDFPDWSTRHYLSRCCRHFAADNLNGRT